MSLMNTVKVKARSKEGFEVEFLIEDSPDDPIWDRSVRLLAWMKKEGFSPIVYASRGGKGAGEQKKVMTLDREKNRVKLYAWFGKTKEERQPFYDAVAEATGVQNVKPTNVWGDRLDDGDKAHYWLPLQFAPALAAHTFFKDFQKPTAAELKAIADEKA